MKSHNLKLTRPIVEFDFETTGPDKTNDRIVQYAMMKLNIDGTVSIIKSKVNPGIPIPESATEIHGITDHDVSSCRGFDFYSGTILSFINGCDLCGYNITGFDLHVLTAECNRVGKIFRPSDHKIIDVFSLYKHFRRRTLEQAFKDYVNAGGMEHAHDAMGDVIATHMVFTEMIKQETDMHDKTNEGWAELSSGDMVDLDGRFKRREDGVVVFGFSKHMGKPVDTEPGMLKWIIDQNGMSPDTKDHARRLLNGESQPTNVEQHDDIPI